LMPDVALVELPPMNLKVRAESPQSVREKKAE
jgi:hypothetical protein